MRRSLRLRLTVLMMVLAAALGAAATVFGLGIVRDRVIDGVADEQFRSVEIVAGLEDPFDGVTFGPDELDDETLDRLEVLSAEDEELALLLDDQAVLDFLVFDPTFVDFLEEDPDFAKELLSDQEFLASVEAETSFVFSAADAAASNYGFLLEFPTPAFENLLDILDVEAGEPLPVLLETGEVGAIAPVPLTGTFGEPGESSTLLPIADDQVVVPSWGLATMQIEAQFVDTSPGVIEAIEVPEEELGEYEAVAEIFNDFYDIRFVERTLDGRPVVLVLEEGGVLDSIDEVRTAMWLATVLLTLLAGVAAWFIMGRALRPVARITAQADSISSGTLHERVPVPKQDDEIGDLAATVNRMLERLEVGDRRRRQFVSDASHELRSPVAVLRTEAEVALRHPDATDVPELAGTVLAESQRMGTIVEDLLTLARRDEGRDLGALAEVDLDDLVLAEAARARRVRIGARAVSAGRVRGRTDDLCRVVQHLLDNGARHARSHVEVGCRTVGDRVQLWVDDDGDGVRSEDRSRIFERFVRLDEARTRDVGGAGLGLAVVAETVRELGGTVTVNDSPLGGARFEIVLPAA